MIAERLKPLMANNSVIRAMFEEGAAMKARYGAENVFDFSLGNPNVPAPREVNESMIRFLTEGRQELHGYMNNAGFPDVREAVAGALNRDHGTAFTAANILMTCGAAGGAEGAGASFGPTARAVRLSSDSMCSKDSRFDALRNSPVQICSRTLFISSSNYL